MNRHKQEAERNSFLSKLNKSQQSLCFIDSIIHFKKAQQVQELAGTKILFLISKKSLIREINNSKYEFIYFKNYISLIKIIFSLRKEKFNFFMAACVDQIYFQLIYFLCSFTFFISIDEGIFSVDKFSRFNSEEHFNKRTHKLFFCLAKIFNYPKVPKYFLKESLFHFGWFDRSLYQGTVLEDKLILMEPTVKPKSSNLKAFIGQPFKWMGLKSEHEDQIINFIKNEKIDIYIKHPRETSKNSIIEKINCPIVGIDTNAENFLNMLHQDKLSVFSYMSSVIFGLSNEIDINIVSLPVTKSLQKRHDDFLHMLKISQIKHTLVPYVR